MDNYLNDLVLQTVETAYVVVRLFGVRLLLQRKTFSQDVVMLTNDWITLDPKTESKPFAVIYMPTSVGNEAKCFKTRQTMDVSGLGIEVRATQATVESATAPYDATRRLFNRGIHRRRAHCRQENIQCAWHSRRNSRYWSTAKITVDAGNGLRYLCQQLCNGCLRYLVDPRS